MGFTTVSSGQSIPGLMAGPGDTINVVNGGTAVAPSIAGATAQLDNSGTVIGATVSNSGVLQQIAGENDGGVVAGGGIVFVFGGVDSGVMVSANGDIVVSGGSDFSATVSSGGLESVERGVASGTQILSGGDEGVRLSGIASGVVVSSGGVLGVFSGGTAIGTHVLSGGSAGVGPSASADNTTVDAGGTFVFGGGTATALQVSAGGTEWVGGAFTFSGTTTVVTGVVLSGNVVSGGVVEVVQSGNSATSAVVSGGTEQVVSGGVGVATTIAGTGAEIGTVLNAGVISAAGDTSDGVSLAGSGVVSNAATGTITAASYHAVGGGGYASIANAGVMSAGGTHSVIAGAAGGNVYNSAGGSITALHGGGIYLSGTDGEDERIHNAASGVITGYVGAYLTGGNEFVTNLGLITGLKKSGVNLLNGGSVSNGQGGTITSQGTLAGVYVGQAAGTVSNDGLISAKNGNGVVLGVAGHITNSGTITATNTALGDVPIAVLVGTAGSGAYVTNAGSGLVVGGLAVRLSGADATLVNNGTLTGGAIGAYLADGGTVSNQGSGTIQSGFVNGTPFVTSYGVKIGHAAGTIRNIGTINGRSQSVVLTAGGLVENLAGGIIVDTASLANVAYSAIALPGSVAATVMNGGTVGMVGTGYFGVPMSGAAGDIGISVSGGLYLSNLASGLIAGVYGVQSTGGPVSIGNAGTIRSNGAPVVHKPLPAGIYVGASSGNTAYVNNAASGVIYGYLGVNFVHAVGTVVNAGTIASRPSAAGLAVNLQAGGAVTNQSKGDITAANSGIFSYYKSTLPTTVTNAGTIGAPFYAIRIGSGTVVNAAGATITSGFTGVKIGKSGTVVNAGTILNTYVGVPPPTTLETTVEFNPTINKYDGGTYTDFINNASTGVILGVNLSVLAWNPTTVMNAGTIGSGRHGAMALSAGGLVNNADHGIIYAIIGGVSATPLTVVNSGQIQRVVGADTIDNNAGAVILYAQTFDTLVNAGVIGNAATIGGTAVSDGGGSLLVVDPGAAFYGLVNGKSQPAGDVSTLELASGASGGVFLGLGTQFINFGQVTIGADANWTMIGKNSVAAGATMTNGGTVAVTGTLVDGGAGFENADAVIVNHGSLAVNSGSFGNDGTVTVENGGTFFVANAAALTGSGSVLMESGSVTEIAVPVPTGQGFFFSDPATLVLDDPAAFDGTIGGLAAGDVIALGSGTITSGHISGTTLTLDLAGGGTQTLNVAPGESGLSFKASSGGLAVACFMAGSRILTATGEVAVEALAVGDLVVTRSGRLRPVRWTGHRTIVPDHHPRPKQVFPVRVQANAFAPGVPHRDLLLSPDHAVHWQDVLIPVRYLCNGATVRQEPVAAASYFHVELDAHDILLAEGLPAESFLDTGNRSAFTNGGAAAAMHPDFALRIWHTEACARLVVDGAELVAARSVLLERAEALGHRVTTDAAPHLVVDGRVVPVEIADGCYRFRLPACARSVRLVSRRAIPAQMWPDSGDHRWLGIAVSRMVLDGEEVPLGDPRLGCGWHGNEENWRWTDGDAILAVNGARVLDVWAAVTARYCGDEAADGARAIS